MGLGLGDRTQLFNVTGVFFEGHENVLELGRGDS